MSILKKYRNNNNNIFKTLRFKNSVLCVLNNLKLADGVFSC